MTTFYAFTPDSRPDVTLHYRKDDGAAEGVVVGVQFEGGKVSYVSKDEAEAHIQAILDASEREIARVEKSWEDRAEAQIAQRAEFGKVPKAVETEIRTQARIGRDEQLAVYRRDIKALVRARRQLIGPVDADLAPAVHAAIVGAA